MPLLIPEIGYLREGRPRPVAGMPLHLTASGSIPPGATQGVNAGALKAPENKPCAISAIKFQIYPTVGGSWLVAPDPTHSYAELLGGASLGALISPSFVLARINGETETDIESISAGRPLAAAICDSRNLSSDIMVGSFLATGNTKPNVKSPPFSEYRWDLEKPLYLPAGVVLVPQFYNAGGFFSGYASVAGTIGTATSNPVPALTVRVSYEGSILSSPNDYDEEVIHVPFCAGYQASTIGAAVYSDTSPETALFNPFQDRVTVTKLIGKLFSTGYFRDCEVDAGQSFLMRLNKSNGDPIVRDFSEFRAVFSRETRCWNTRLFLDPGEYLTSILSMVGSAGFFNNGAVYAPFASAVQPVLGVTGYRDIPRARLE